MFAGQPLKDIFNSFIAEAGERFPELAGRFLIMDVNAYTVYGMSTLDPEKIRADKSKLPLYLGNHGITQDLKRHPEKTSCAYFDKPTGINIIFFSDDIDPEIAGAAAERALRRLKRLLDHEVAHLGIEDGLYEKKDTPQELLGECIADAYALIRHYQRHGTEMECIDKYVSPFARAQGLIFGDDAAHFTTFVLQEITKCRNALDIANFDEEKTASVARQFARQYAPSMETVNELKEAFRPVKDLWKTDRDAAVQKLIGITLGSNNEAVFKTGQAWLQVFATSGVTFKTGKIPTLSREDKKDLMAKLQQRDYHFSRCAKQNRQRKPHAEWRKLGLNG